jgi:hypothetical protein
VLSVVVRWEPTLTLVNGTLVARAGEIRPSTRWCRWLAAQSQGEFVLGDQLHRRQAANAARQRSSVPSGRGRLRRSGPPPPGTDRPAGHGKADSSLGNERILIRVLHGGLFPQDHTGDLRERRTVGDRSAPMACGPNVDRHAPLVGQRRPASRTLPRQGRPRRLPPTSEPRAGDRLGRGSPGRVWPRDIPLFRRAVPGHGMVVPQRAACSKPHRRWWLAWVTWSSKAAQLLTQKTVREDGGGGIRSRFHPGSSPVRERIGRQGMARPSSFRLTPPLRR